MSGTPPGPVVVVGGAGRTGRRVVARLRERGLPVRVVSRHAATAGPQEGVEHVRGDLAALDAAALEGATGVVVGVEPPYDAAGADAVLHRGLAGLARTAAAARLPVVLVSQIYITRPEAYPRMRDVVLARGRGEEALRASGAPYVIVRPGWLTDDPARGVRLEQGDTGDGRVSRDAVADAAVAGLLTGAFGRTFEIYDADPPATEPVEWSRLLPALHPDAADVTPEAGRGR